MQEAQTAQASRAGAGVRQFGDHDGRGVAHDDHAHPALSVKNKADLPRDKTRERGQFMRLLRTVAAHGRIAALTEAIQSFQFAGLESSGISFNVCGYGGPPALNARQGLSRPAASEDCTRT